jgi:uncharacterized protein YbjQ (UPF0145 family)
MRWFGLGGRGDTPEQEAARQRQEASRRSLESGGLPLNAVDRLREQAARQGTAGHLFTSDLSVNELSLVRQAGYEALGQVMGSSVYHVGWQRMPAWSWRSGELEVLTQAFYNARHLALGRLRQEAALLGATGVVGVRLERQEYTWGAELLEFAAIGTAIREQDTTPGAAGAEPFLSDLSGEEFWLLRQAGYRSIGFVVGNCTYYQVPTWRTQDATTGGFLSGSWLNQELPDYTQALYAARELAMSRMEQEARAAGAEGVVGADVQVQATPREVELNNQRRIDMLYHFTAVGTAIAPADGGHHGALPVESTLPLE